jgi:hypothetical protein
MIKEMNMRTKLIKLIMVLALGAVICLPEVASAYLAPGTWREAGSETATIPFTKLEVFVTDSTILTDPVLVNLNKTTWTSTLVNEKYFLAEGPPPGTIDYRWQFPDPNTTPREVEYLVWNGDELNSSQHIIFTGSGYRYPTDTRDWGYYEGDGVHDFYGNLLPSREDPLLLLSAAVPLPPSVLLLGSGLLGLGFLPRRKQSEV